MRPTPWYLDARVLVTLLLAGFLALVLIPLPPAVLDVLITFSLMMSVGLVLTALFLQDAREFYVFPSLLLLTTLLRLALNIASTRLILLHGAEGEGAAGRVIAAFGEVVMGGDYVVGAILFLIFTIINFIVISKGSERVAEVAARFTLDALPGKQMAIDADLSSGLIDQEEAARRREELQKEAEFYGAMDGASKFVRGDAIASLLIAFVNLIGGMAVGIARHGLSAKEAAATFSILTVGDGLAAQIPALLVSASAGLVITRVGGQHHVGFEIARQLGRDRRIWLLTAGIFAVIALVPGMPTLPFLAAALLTAALARFLPRLETEEPQAGTAEETDERKPHLARPEAIEVALGYSLLPLTTQRGERGLLKRITRWREEFAKRWGFWLPVIHVHDDAALPNRGYEIRVRGVTVAHGELWPARLLALDTGELKGVIDGQPARDPVYGSAAWWITTDQRKRAEAAGAVVVGPDVVLLTHLSEAITPRAHELLDRPMLRRLLEELRQQGYAELDELVPGVVDYGRLLALCQQLLRERVPIIDLARIVETAGAVCAVNPNATVEDLVETVREALSSLICSRLADAEGRIPVLTLAPDVERGLMSGGNAPARAEDFATLGGQVARLLPALKERLAAAPKPPKAILVSPPVRRPLRQVLEHVVPDLAVISFREIARGYTLEPVGSVGYAA